MPNCGLRRKRIFSPLYYISRRCGAAHHCEFGVDFGKDFRPFNVDWFVWAILIWFFIFLVHFLNVFVLNAFMDKKWEHEQIDKLVARQNARITELKDKVELETRCQKKITAPL